MKKSRKKMLISSIAMLLVAMIALGSATFAWFSMNRNVTSDNMNIKSSAAKGLLITNDRGANWSNTANFTAYTSKVFTPVSVNYTNNNAYTTFGTPYYVEDNTTDGKAEGRDIGGTWASTSIPTITATATSGGAAADNVGKASNRNDYFAVYEVGIKSTGDAINTVTLAASIQDSGDYARVAIIDNGTVTPSGTAFSAAAPTAVYGVETTPKAVTTISGTSFGTATAQKLESVTESADYDNQVATGLTAPADDSTASTKGHYFTIIVWFEGEDSNCTDNAQSKDLELALKFSY